MNCEISRPSTGTTQARGIARNALRILRLSILITSALMSGSTASTQTYTKRDVLILSEVGLSHSLTNIMTQQIVAGVEETPGRHVEFFSESLDLLSFRDGPSPAEAEDWLSKKYGGQRLDVVIAIGPGAIGFLANRSRTMFSEVPIVICGSSVDQAGHPLLDSRFTGTWQRREPVKTLEAALLLFPDTRHVIVVGGSSTYDKQVISATRDSFSSFEGKAEISYLVDLEIGELLERLRNLPERSIVFYLSFFQDGAGNRFVNATKALPMVAAAANAPVFGMSDTYLSHGIVGGDLMNFGEQGKITAGIVAKLLDGARPVDIPIRTLSSEYMFDWNELQRWHIPESRLPSGSIMLFREPSLWERTKWMWALAFLIILGLAALAVFLQHSRKQLELARTKQRQLSGMLINAEEQERSRVASELHDDFSQRLAILSLGLENVEEATPVAFTELHRQLRELINSTGELGSDLHTLSHRLHSSTLESLGLGPAIGSLCKEFSAQQKIAVHFESDVIPRSIQPNAALCVFRIVQEALRNLKKHSGAKEGWVHLRNSRSRLEVFVRDEGCGFNLKELSEREGLGIRSMSERVRLLGGELKIQSAPRKGTTVLARIPLESQRAGEKDQRS